MIKPRIPKSEQALQLVRSDFLNNIEKTTLSDLSLEELADRYVEIENQSHLMKGLILLEARGRFPSDKEFGQWVQATLTLCQTEMKTRNRLMHYAKFFKDRDQTGISLTACYAIAAPANESVAEAVYEIVQGQNLPVEEVKQIIRKTKGTPELRTPPKDITIHQIKNRVINLVNQLEEEDAIEVLETCLRMVKHETVEVTAKTDTGRKRF